MGWQATCETLPGSRKNRAMTKPQTRSRRRTRRQPGTHRLTDIDGLNELAAKIDGNLETLRMTKLALGRLLVRAKNL